MPFSAEWLSLREPADRAARSRRVTEWLVKSLTPARTWDPALAGFQDGPPEGEPHILRIVDLGCGTGANVRALAAALPAPQRWLLVDNDKALLELATSKSRDLSVETREADLNHANYDDITGGQHLVTASALLDLVSEPWLRSLVEACRRHEAAVLFVLNYDGRMICTPRDRDDDLVRDLVNRHQRRDKGFGPALGPAATDVAEHLLREAGYAIERDSSDWVLAADAKELQSALIAGWVDAAIELVPERGDAIRAWSERRLAHIARGESQMRVGHQDLSGTLKFGIGN